MKKVHKQNQNSHKDEECYRELNKTKHKDKHENKIASGIQKRIPITSCLAKEM